MRDQCFCCMLSVRSCRGVGFGELTPEGATCMGWKGGGGGERVRGRGGEKDVCAVRRNSRCSFEVFRTSPHG